MQRCFCYATQDVRDAYGFVKQAALNEKYKKIVLILHSQGGVEGGLILDWLFDALDEATLNKFEIFTFGNAANHWNNPSRRKYPAKDRLQRCIPHIEHYVNSRDFVAMWGVLDFITIPGRYLGDVFIQQGSGHLLNQHYLDTMFPLSCEDNDFLEQDVELNNFEPPSYILDFKMAAQRHTQIGHHVDGNSLKMKDCSRLWRYRNGRSPDG